MLLAVRSLIKLNDLGLKDPSLLVRKALAAHMSRDGSQSVSTRKCDDITTSLLKKIEGKLDEIDIKGAFAELEAQSKTCLLSELSLITCRSLRGEFSLYEAVVKMEQIARDTILPQSDKMDRTVGRG